MTPENPPPRSDQDLGRELSTHIVIFHQAVAERVNISATENKCLDILIRNGPITAGELSEITGLTTGSITKIVDRLEKMGYAKRERSQIDRRQVIIHPTPQNENEMGQIFSSLAIEMNKVAKDYSSKELAVIQDYLAKIIDVLKKETNKLKE